jgi:pSer/pThr/pTyr-binding forkhead associated (FHA) protein
MGRGHESDLRINDISVSRLHALIKYKDGKFLLEDNVSKFGTLVLIKKRTSLISGFNKAVQIGRTVINFSVKSLNNCNTHPRSSLFGPKIAEEAPLQEKHKDDLIKLPRDISESLQLVH